LDEPTNDLDIDTLELLEQLLLEYSGTLFIVSHDRAFLDNVVTQVIAYDGDGNWIENAGGYDDWQSFKQRQASAEKESRIDPKSVTTAKSSPAGAGPKPIKLSFKEQKELAALPDRITALEQEQSALTARMEDSALYRDATESQRVSKRLGQIEVELDTLMTRWTELESRVQA
jgi:ABC transport system ATP-binding/permease protein